MNVEKIEEAINEISGARALLNCVGASINANPQPAREALENALLAIECQLERTEKKLEAVEKELLAAGRQS